MRPESLSRRLRQEPLLLFLLAGLLLFAFHRLFGAATETEGTRTIEIDRESMLRFTQFRSRLFDERGAEQAWATMPIAEKKLMLDQFVREEALYREALDWGLDRNDYVIRRRLVQSLEFALAVEESEPIRLTEAQLRSYHAAHAGFYREPARISFAQVFFSKIDDGEVAARTRAIEALELLRRGAGRPAHMGDRFLYFADYSQQRDDTIRAHFGDAMAEALFSLQPGPDWHGPIESDHGVHLVRIVTLDHGGLPAFETVRDRVASDATADERRRRQEDSIARIVATYRRQFAPELEQLR